MGWGKALFVKLTDAGEAESHAGRVLLEERYRALQRQIPLLYIVILSNLLGLALAAGGDLSAPFKVVTLLIGLVVFRLAHWLMARDRVLPPERILRELRKTWVY